MKENWWEPALFFYLKVTSWIIFPVLLAWLLSKFLIKNNHETIFLFLILLSFCLTCYGIYREIKIYKNEVDNQK